MRARGFTAVELALVLSISTLVGSACYLLLRNFERHNHAALGAGEAARGMRVLSEEIRRDLRTLRFEPGPALSLRGPCGRVEYLVQEGAVIRRGDAGCGAPRAVCSGVSSLARTPLGIEVIFARRIDAGPPATTRFLLAAGGAP